MHSSFIEVEVHRKTNKAMKYLSILFTVLAVLIVGFGFYVFRLTIILMGVPFIILAWLTHRDLEVDYEYIYVDGELRVSKISNKSRRKNIGQYDLSSMEILAPAGSYHLDEYKNRTVKDLDFSSHEVTEPDPRYYLYLSGDRRMILEPTEDLVDAIRMIAPRKVFKD